jgi:hypothetical protein
MLFLSGQHSKEVSYEHSISREQRLCVFLSTLVASGHEGHFHRSLFFAVDGPGSPTGPFAALDAGVRDLRFAADGVGRIGSLEGSLRPRAAGRGGDVPRSQTAGPDLPGVCQGLPTTPPRTLAGPATPMARPPSRQRRVVLAPGRVGGLRGRRHPGRTAADGREREGLRLCRAGQDRAAVAVDEPVPQGYGSAVGRADRGGDRVGRGICASWWGYCPAARGWWRTRGLPASTCWSCC